MRYSAVEAAKNAAEGSHYGVRAVLSLALALLLIYYCIGLSLIWLEAKRASMLNIAVLCFEAEEQHAVAYAQISKADYIKSCKSVTSEEAYEAMCKAYPNSGLMPNTFSFALKACLDGSIGVDAFCAFAKSLDNVSSAGLGNYFYDKANIWCPLALFVLPAASIALVVYASAMAKRKCRASIKARELDIKILGSFGVPEKLIRLPFAFERAAIALLALALSLAAAHSLYVYYLGAANCSSYIYYSFMQLDSLKGFWPYAAASATTVMLLFLAAAKVKLATPSYADVL
ncbi:MAG: hypothetical protein FWG30_04875 [Eubacteriaceae bacterium]|nr:hypothetical protein [Eubacteriaceae bacterium]